MRGGCARWSAGNEHFKDNGSYIHVRGKFAKERDVALTTKARKTLDEQWADAGDPQSLRPKNSRPWWQHESRFAQVMRKGCERAGIQHLSPHDLRHTFGHRFLVKGGDIYVLSKILGHSSVAVTERHYAYLRREDVAEKMLAVMEPAKPPAPPTTKRTRGRKAGRKRTRASAMSAS